MLGWAAAIEASPCSMYNLMNHEVWIVITTLTLTPLPQSWYSFAFIQSSNWFSRVCTLILTTPILTLTPVMIQNGTVMGALTRVFQEEFKKSTELTFNILRVFLGNILSAHTDTHTHIHTHTQPINNSAHNDTGIPAQPISHVSHIKITPSNTLYHTNIIQPINNILPAYPSYHSPYHISHSSSTSSIIYS